MTITISAAQYPITEHKSFADWAAHIEKWVSEAVITGAQLLVFPEYGSMELVSIFSNEIRADIRRQVKELDLIKEDFCNIFSDLAKKYKTIIVAPSIPVIEANRNVNRVYVFSEKGLVGYQDKLFMTRFENEEWGIESGDKTLTLFEASWGSFGIQICYDVEFGIGSQLLSSAGASLIIAPSCTETIRGATRVHIGARARALENQIYTAVSQTVGNAQWSPAVDINYGYSAFYSTPDKDLPEEGIISTMTPQHEGWLTATLDISQISDVRNNGQVFNFKDQQRIKTGFAEQDIQIIRKMV
jgi:predicted amidohydrolase